MSKKTSRGHDPLWAQAKQVCRLNQQDITMAQQLGMTPKSLMKNNPSPSQKWKQPVKYWIRELHQKRFGQPDLRNSRPGGMPESASRPSRNPGIGKKFESEADPWDEDFENFHDFAGAMLPHLEFDAPLEHDPEDPDWEHFRRDRRQKNLCWTACSLTARFRALSAVEKVTVFGSVATSVRRPFGQPWDGPEAAAVCHTLNLAVWVSSTEPATLCSLELMIRQTLTSLADVECITLHRDRLEILLLEASSNRFLGLLRPGATPEVAPGIEVPAGYVFRLEPLCPPQGIVTFQSQPPPRPAAVEDEDVPF